MRDRPTAPAEAVDECRVGAAPEGGAGDDGQAFAMASLRSKGSRQLPLPQALRQFAAANMPAQFEAYAVTPPRVALRTPWMIDAAETGVARYAPATIWHASTAFDNAVHTPAW